MIALLQGCANAASEAPAVADRQNSADAAVALHTTPDGHRFWFHAMPESDRTAVAVTWSAALPDGPDTHPAAARVGIELMLNGGAGGMAAEEIIADFQDLDSGSRLWVQPTEISGFIVSPQKHMQRAAEIANLVLTQPNLEQRWFDREKKSLYDNAVQRDTVVFGLAWNLAREMTLGDHPYKNFWSLRPADEINAITLAQVEQWHQQAFTTAALTITAAGNASADQLAAEIDRVLQDMPAGSKPEIPVFDEPAFPGKTVLLHQPDAPKSAILIMGNLPPHGVDMDLPVQLGVGVLGFGKQSRLFKAVRSGLRAAYGFSAGMFDKTRDHRLLHISGEVETAKLQAALNETEKTYEEFRDKGIGRLEFPIARRFLANEMNGELKKPESVAYLLMEAQRNQFGEDYVPTMLDRLGNLERSAVNALLKEQLPAFDSLLKIIVTPDADAIDGACVITSIDDWAQC